MTGPARPPTALDSHRDAGAGHHGGHSGHSGWAMLICCIPMVIAIVAIILAAATGAAPKMRRSLGCNHGSCPSPAT